MFYTYVLFSKDHNKIYIGFTSNLENRLHSHNVLANKGYTVKFRPWELIYSEDYGSKYDAIKREKELKSSRGRAFIWGLIQNRKSK